MKKFIKFTKYIKENNEEDKEKNTVSGGDGVAFVTLNQNGMGKIIAPIMSETPGSINQDSGTIGSGEAYHNKIFTFMEYIKEQDGGGGVAFATANANGMGNVVAPTVGTTPGAVWGTGSGTIGSGDAVATANDLSRKYGQNSTKKEKKKKSKKAKTKEDAPRYFTKEYMAL